MEEDLRKVCFKEKLELMWQTSVALGSATRSYQIAVEKKPVLLRIMLKEAGGFDRPVFSDFYTFFKDLDDCSMDAEKIEKLDDLPLGILIEKDSLLDANLSDLLNSETLDTFLNPGFEFSNDPGTFVSQFFTILKVFSVVEVASDPRVDLAAMKALFHAGRMIERLEHEGKKKSDIPSKAGRKPKKSRYGNDAIIHAFRKCDGKNLNAMAVEIEAFLANHKKEHKTKKDVPSISTIKRALRHNGLDKELKK